MNTPLADMLWLNEADVCRIEQLAEISGLSIEEIEDLIDNGVIAPADTSVQPPSFQLRCIVTVKTARRLRDDFQLDRHGITLALTLLQRISELEEKLGAQSAVSGGSTVKRNWNGP